MIADTDTTPMVRLDQLLSHEQIKAVTDILNVHGSKDPCLALPTLRAYLDGFSEPLREKGVLSDYLAYAIVAGLMDPRKRAQS